MSQEYTSAQILDLTSNQTLFELAIEEKELLGREGAKLIADLRERASEADYTHMYFRDPMRPGIIWFSLLGEYGLTNLPTRGRLEECWKISEKVFPGFLSTLENEEEDQVMSQVPPITTGHTGLELATALEYLIFVHPEMVRAWAALIFTYDQILGLREAAENVRNACLQSCTNAQVVLYLLSDSTEDLPKCF